MGCTASNSATNHTNTISINIGVETDTVDGFHDKYLLGAKLGRGAFAQVRLAIRTNSDVHRSERAVKILDLRDSKKDGQPSRSLQKAAHNEASLWAGIGSHPNSVRLYDVFYSAELCYMVMEKCASSLFHYLAEMPELNERSLGNIFLQMLVGLGHVHSARVVHRDVKPDNFLVGGEDGQTLKLADFGLSAMLPAEGKLMGVFGTAPFMCPEMLMGQGYDERSDVWSLGVIVYALLFGNFPYVPKEASSQAMKQAIVVGSPPAFEPSHRSAATPASRVRSESADGFVKTLLTRDPDQRLSAVEALNLTYMVMVTEDRHMIGSTVPSLRSMLHSAKKYGAFEVRDPSRETPLDGLLNKLHMAKHGTPVPEVVRSPDHSRSVKKQSLPPVVSRVPSQSSNREISEAGSCSTEAGSSTTSPRHSAFHKGSGWSKSTLMSSN
jgi:serine/threonine protein kinase